MQKLRFTRQRTVTVNVPERYRAIMERDTLDITRSTDSNGNDWRHATTSQPYRCSICGRWRTGRYYLALPIVACPSHFTRKG